MKEEVLKALESGMNGAVSMIVGNLEGSRALMTAIGSSIAHTSRVEFVVNV